MLKIGWILLLLASMSSFAQVKVSGGGGPDDPSDPKWAKEYAALEKLEESFVGAFKSAWPGCFQDQPSFQNIVDLSTRLILKQDLSHVVQKLNSPEVKCDGKPHTEGFKCLHTNSSRKDLKALLGGNFNRYLAQKYRVSEAEAEGLKAYFQSSL